MTRVFRSFAILSLAGHLLVMWMAVIGEPRTFYWQILNMTGYPLLVAWSGLGVAVWLAIDVALINAFPGFCRIGDRIRIYPLAAALMTQAVMMYAGHDHPIIWIDWGKDVLLTLGLMFSDALYNRRKYRRGHVDGGAHAQD